MDMKPTLYESLLGYQCEPYPGGILGAAIRRQDRFVGRLAERWTVSPDGRVIEMTLREGVRSAAGNILSAEDVKYTLDRGFHVPGFYKWTAQVGGLASNNDVEVIGRQTVRFTLAAPSAFFLDTRVFPMNGIFDSALIRAHSTADDPWGEKFVAANAAGFGPYRIESVDPASGAVYRARGDYYRGKPAFDPLVYHVIPDPAERAAKLASGELDYAFGLSLPQILGLGDAPGIRAVAGPSTSVYHLSLNCRVAPFDDARLRRAVAYAIPYDTILRDVLLGAASPWRGFIPPVVEGYDDTRWPYVTDPERARAEAAAAGGPPKETVTILCNAGSPAQLPAAELIAGALQAIGWTANVEVAAPPEFFRRRLAGDYCSLLTEAGPMVPDAGYQLSHDFCSDSTGNDFGYANPQVDELVRRGLGELNAAKRLALYAEAQRRMTEDMPVVPLASLGFAAAFSRRIDGLAWYPDNVPHYGELSPAGVLAGGPRPGI